MTAKAGTVRVTLTGVLAVTSAVISVSSFTYTLRTYAVTHRPYVGVYEVNYQLLGTPSTGMSRAFVLKNVGSVPAWLSVDENSATVRAGGQTRTLPILGEPGGRMFLMPGQTANLNGHFTDASGIVLTSDVLSGKTTIDVTIHLSYEASGALWWKNAYYYRSINRFTTDSGPPAFVNRFTEAN